MCSPIRPTKDNHPQSSSPNKEGTVRQLRPHKNFIVPDQTLLERQEDLALRKRLRKRRDASPEKKLRHPGAQDSPPGIRGLNLVNTNGQDVNSVHNGVNVLNVVNRNYMSRPDVDQNSSAPERIYLYWIYYHCRHGTMRSLPLFKIISWKTGNRCIF